MRTLLVTGHIVADAEKKISKSGKEYLSFRIANNEFNDEKGDDGKTKPYWIGVTSFNQRHFSMTQYLTKGKPVIVDGDYSDRIYRNKEGNCEISRDILANAIYFLPGSGDDSNSGGNSTKAEKANDAPTVQTTMKKPKPTTAQLEVPSVKNDVDDDDNDELPF